MRLSIALVFSAGLITLGACSGGDTTPITSAVFSHSPTTQGVAVSAPLASPSSLTFGSPSDSPQTITVTVSNGGRLEAASSDTSVATVNPPAQPSSHISQGVRQATFTVTPVGPGGAVITITDPKSGAVTVGVTVGGGLL
jgi:hypothetical protein